MIHKIYSRIDPSILLHIIFKKETSLDDFSNVKREEISEPDQCLQAMFLNVPAQTQVKPHTHNSHERHTYQTHEGLLVFKGSIELSIYDIDNSFVEKHVLHEGDFYMIVNGGHSMKTLTPAHLFEFKNGPYYGPEKDKKAIN